MPSSASSSMSLMPTTGVQYKGISMPIPSWKDASDLAMVRDWFYPHRRRYQQQKQQDIGQALLESIAQSFDHGTKTDNDAISGNTKTDQRETEDEQQIQHTNYRRAIDRVEIYKWRDETTPHAIVATAALIDAKLHYETEFQQTAANPLKRKRHDHTKHHMSAGAMKSIYAMSFCRFVNGFVDRDIARSSKARREAGISVVVSATTTKQTSTNISSAGPQQNENDTDESDNNEDDTKTPKGAGESSMYAHAQHIGMPSSFVDLRHRATHGRGRDLPSLSELQVMTEKALKWLWEKWWVVHSRPIEGDAELRIWQVERWDALMDEHLVEVVRLEEEERSGNVLRGKKRWKSVTENGVTKFLCVDDDDDDDDIDVLDHHG